MLGTMSIRTRLLLGIWLLLIFPVCLLWFQIINEPKQTLKLNQARLDQHVEEMAFSVGEQLLEWQSDADLASELYRNTLSDTALTPTQKLNQLAALFPVFEWIVLYSQTGEILAKNQLSDRLNLQTSGEAIAAQRLSNELISSIHENYKQQQQPIWQQAGQGEYQNLIENQQLQFLGLASRENSDTTRLVWLINGNRLFSYIFNRKSLLGQHSSDWRWQSLTISNQQGVPQFVINYPGTTHRSGQHILTSKLVPLYPNKQQLEPWQIQVNAEVTLAEQRWWQADLFWAACVMTLMAIFLPWWLTHYFSYGLARLLSQIEKINHNQEIYPINKARVAKHWQGLIDAVEKYQGMYLSQKQLTESYKQFQQELLLKGGAMDAVNASLVVVDSSDLHFPVIYANHAYCQEHDASAGAMIGQTCRYLDSQYSSTTMVSTLSQAISRVEPSDVLQKQAKAGGAISWTHIHFAPIVIPDQPQRYFVAIGNDVTQLKAYEKRVRDLNISLEQRVNTRTLALQQAEHQLRATLDTMSDALVVAEPNGTIKDINRTAINLFGFRSEELLGQNLALVIADREQITNIESWFSSLLVGKTKKMGSQVETLAINKSGGLFAVEVSVTCVRSKYQQTYTMVLRDISDRKAAEIRLRNAKDEAELANRTKSEFLANMSHELRTPMNAVIGMTDIVLDTELSREQRRHLTTVSKSAHALLGLLNDILDLTKLERGSMELERLSFDVRRSLNSVINMMELQARKKGLKLSFQVTNNVPKLVMGDPAKLRQVLINLIGNAIKFTEKGEIKLNAFYQEGGNSEQLNFVVADSGIGIPKDRLEHIFKPFVQSDGSISRRYGGTGLGTTISRELVEKMGGQIWVESELGVGSRFYFFIYAPASENQEEVQYQEDNPLIQYKVIQPLKILLAEDVAVNAELIQTRLGRDQHIIDWAKDGVEAVDHFEQAHGEYDLVLMDIHMPNMNGFEAHAKIKELGNQWQKQVPVIALTASGMRRDVDQCRDEGMDGFVIKPVDFSLLNNEMAKLVPGHFAVNMPESIESGQQSHDNANDVFANVRHCIQVDKALINWGDEQLFLKMLREFPDHWETVVNDVNQALTSANYELAKAETHKLKGVAGGLGMEHLYDATRQLDEALSEEAAEAKLFGLLSELEDSLFAVNSAINKLPVSQAHEELCDLDVEPIDMDELLAKLLIFREKLERGMQDDDELDMLSLQLRAYQHADLATLLVEMTDDFNFTGAIGVIDQCAERINQLAERSHG
ncbi:ATP-binding protein [Shewanella sp. NIFS-20-20]|uniref:PAS domain-containing hybrid sensor histidine kinase/response regulator n=1 Tax=Shewanella sp. NIFS-20-20 TaxID=2853806 RepID=UPI001C496E93|nr:ATP-binding protein [Shewanella sp. NIFS-20-20]MBV7315361.1 PAS domain S-box protein [Shewanella sp. NIFS-20-20]